MREKKCECDTLKMDMTNNLFCLQFTNDKGHIFVSVHLADEVRAPSDMMDDVLRQGLNSLKDGSERNTLSGYQIVDRWKSWENFKQLGGKESIESSELIKLIVSVEDTGEGIPQEAHSRIFTPFMQADSSTSRHHGGTGIGLSISKCLVELMGGEIGFVSKRNVGSTFSFTAVLMRGELESLDPKRHIHETSISELKGLRALVIDKRSIRAEVTRYHLHRLGISVDTVSSLQSASSFVSDNLNTRLGLHPLPPSEMVCLWRLTMLVTCVCVPIIFACLCT